VTEFWHSSSAEPQDSGFFQSIVRLHVKLAIEQRAKLLYFLGVPSERHTNACHYSGCIVIGKDIPNGCEMKKPDVIGLPKSMAGPKRLEETVTFDNPLNINILRQWRE